MKARQPDEAQGALAWLLRRRWGITALRENARLTLERLQYIGLNKRDRVRAKQAEFRASARGKARADALETHAREVATIARALAGRYPECVRLVTRVAESGTEQEKERLGVTWL